MIKTRQNGSALLTALFMITLIAIIATAMSGRLQTDIQRIASIETTDRLHLASQAGSFWAMDRIIDPKQSLQQASSTGMILRFPKKLEHIYPAVTLSGQVFDLQARFNLNNLSQTPYQAIFFGLLSELHPSSSAFERKNMMDAIINWISPIQSQVRHDEWYDRYARQTPLYFPSHMPMRHISELRLVYGVSAKRYRIYSPFLTVLPETTAININSAPKQILLALGTGIKDDELSHILNERKQKAYADLSAISPFLEKYHIPPTVLTVESYYFLVVTRAVMSDITISTYTILNRKKDKHGNWHVRIISESINTI